MKLSINNYTKNGDERKNKIIIDKWDTWNMDHTLALIIHPMLIQLKETKHGSPFVDDDDVPEHLQSTSAPPKKNEWDIDAFHHDRWNWIIDELIWTFGSILNDDIETEDIMKRQYNGLRLFGKYFRCLWD